MADDTLSPVGFDRRTVKLALPDESRFALACLFGDAYKHGTAFDYEQALVRHVLDAGLTALGWPLERRIGDLAAHRIRCLKSGATNAYGRE